MSARVSLRVRAASVVAGAFLLAAYGQALAAEGTGLIYGSADNQACAKPGLASDRSVIVEKQGRGIVLTFQQKEAATVLPEEIQCVQSIFRISERILLVLGKVTETGERAVILDVEKASIIDQFLGYDMSVSPNGRYIAFTRFFPEHFVTAAQATNIAMVYDLQKSPRANREGFDLSEDIDVGGRVYPALAVSTSGTGNSVHTFMSTQFFWSPDSAKFIFLDETPQQAGLPSAPPRSNIHLPPRPVLSLVAVLLGANGHAPSVESYRLPFCPAVVGASCLTRLVDVSFDTKNVTIKLQGFLANGGFATTRSIELTRFAALP